MKSRIVIFTILVLSLIHFESVLPPSYSAFTIFLQLLCLLGIVLEIRFYSKFQQGVYKARILAFVEWIKLRYSLGELRLREKIELLSEDKSTDDLVRAIAKEIAAYYRKERFTLTRAKRVKQLHQKMLLRPPIS